MNRRAPSAGLECPGHLVAFPSGNAVLDGFWYARPRPSGRVRPALLLFVHGMRSNFYRSRLKKELLRQTMARPDSPDVLLFNNRGAEDGVLDERFADARADLAAALAFGRAHGYRRFLLAGHSTGCQKIIHLLASPRPEPGVAGVMLLGPCDDLAITRRDFGSQYDAILALARHRVADGRGGEPMPDRRCGGFTARRFLSASDARHTEARILDYEGRLTAFRRVRAPMLVLFGSREEYACLPVEAMLARLQASTASAAFQGRVIPGGDHGFHGVETETVRVLLDWAEMRPGPAGRRTCHD